MCNPLAIYIPQQNMMLFFCWKTTSPLDDTVPGNKTGKKNSEEMVAKQGCQQRRQLLQVVTLQIAGMWGRALCCNYKSFLFASPNSFAVNGKLTGKRATLKLSP
uniref:Uncharacterized protein n=1 Tax=Sphaerodactylus townsendi TaxID=933632 RepID=A0ACB8F0T7_9SAUR